MDLLSPIDSIKGVGEKTAGYLQKLGVYSIEDILLFFPRIYSDFPAICNLKDAPLDQTVAICLDIKTPVKLVKARNMDLSVATGYAGATPVELVWFRASYIRSVISAGESYVFLGKLQKQGNRFKLEQPDYYSLEKYNQLRYSLQPIYPLTKGLKNNVVKKTVQSAFESVALSNRRLPDFVEEREHFLSYSNALFTYHFPNSLEDLVDARKRLAYEELFYFILNTKLLEQGNALQPNNFDIHGNDIYDFAIESLPFALTKGQQGALDEVINDLESDYINQRLIQGDVGSGKTMVAFLAMLRVISNGYQAAIMAPTEVLAMQHYETFCKYVKDFRLPYKVAVLTGSMKASMRKEMQKLIDQEEALFIIGTHALISEKSSYSNLGLVVTDEQHRFGVKQREKFFEKGNKPHILVMSATPIPRTLAMILYGNMSVSVINEMPVGRLPIKTCVISDSKRNSAFKFIKDEIEKGHQAYIICPLVEASETTEAENVTDYAQNIDNYFKGSVTYGILHGKMKPDDKNQIMNDFASGKLDILVSTTVVEVGVNVPNATVMMIENANRFGLAQLHQLRGRVGRGQDQSYCILMNTSKDASQSDRLNIMLKSNDGFEIAREDLKLRGPGDFFGIRQSGDFNFKVADITADAQLIEQAASDVEKLLSIEEYQDKYGYVIESMNHYIDMQSYVL